MSDPYEQRMRGIYFTHPTSGQLYSPTVQEFVDLAQDLHLADGPADASSPDPRVPSHALEQLAAKGQKGTHFGSYVLDISTPTRHGMMRPGDRMVRHVHTGTGHLTFAVRDLDIRLVSSLANRIAAALVDADNQALPAYIPEDERPEYWEGVGYTPVTPVGQALADLPAPEGPTEAERMMDERTRHWERLPYEGQMLLDRMAYVNSGLLCDPHTQAPVPPQVLSDAVGQEAFERWLEAAS